MNDNFAEFEKHSTGFGSRILKKHGWERGSGAGPSGEGIREPIRGAGHKPYERTGLGYYGEKLNRVVEKGRREVVGEVEISTVFDREVDRERDCTREEMMRYQGLNQLKSHDWTHKEK